MLRSKNSFVVVGGGNAMSKRAAKPLVRPSLPCARDFGLIRISGSGLGNCLFAYFHSVLFARAHGLQVIAPNWSSIKIGPLLRGERSLRQYGSVLRAHPEEVKGWHRAVALLWYFRTRSRLIVPCCNPPALDAARMLATSVESFSFVTLQEHRAFVRQRIVDIIASPIAMPDWGRGSFIGVHIRLGDFAPATGDQLRQGSVNARLPLDWYVDVIKRLHNELGEMPVHIFSDGREAELAPILAIRGTRLRREASDVADLLALCESAILVGSNSTFSQWAAFLGDMPSVWLDSAARPEKPSSATTPIAYVSLDSNVEEPIQWSSTMLQST